MTDKQLSPEAQAIVDAYANTIGYHAGFASVLREVVKQLKYIGITEKNILSIAKELEGKK